MLDENKKTTSIDIFIIIFFSIIIVTLSMLIVATIIDMQEQSDFIDSLDDMVCSELLTEIKNDHPMYKGYGYLETWVEKECWK